MGIETSAEHGGSEMSFMAAILAVEGQSESGVCLRTFHANSVKTCPSS
jgi:hypothetical protein